MEKFKVIFIGIILFSLGGCFGGINPYLIEHPEPLRQAADLGGQALDAALCRITKGIDPSKPISDAKELNTFIQQYLKAPKTKVIYDDKFDPNHIGAAIDKDKKSYENEDILMQAIIMMLSVIGGLGTIQGGKIGLNQIGKLVNKGKIQ